MTLSPMTTKYNILSTWKYVYFIHLSHRAMLGKQAKKSTFIARYIIFIFHMMGAPSGKNHSYRRNSSFNDSEMLRNCGLRQRLMEQFW
jgi:hypothetical protein